LRFLTDREVEVEVGDGEDGFHVSNREISGVGGANPGSPTSLTKASGFEIGPVFKRGPSKENSPTSNRTTIKSIIILTPKLLLYIL
jgi:hypothetical protein